MSFFAFFKVILFIWNDYSATVISPVTVAPLPSLSKSADSLYSSLVKVMFPSTFVPTKEKPFAFTSISPLIVP